MLKGTKVLGRLACIVLFKVIGLGSADRNWKELKRVETPTRNQLKSAKVAKLTTLVGHHCTAKSYWHWARLARAGKLWTDDNVEILKLARFGIDTSALSGVTKPNHVIRAWRCAFTIAVRRRDISPLVCMTVMGLIMT